MEPAKKALGMWPRSAKPHKQLKRYDNYALIIRFELFVCRPSPLRQHIVCVQAVCFYSVFIASLSLSSAPFGWCCAVLWFLSDVMCFDFAHFLLLPLLLLFSHTLAFFFCCRCHGSAALHFGELTWNKKTTTTNVICKVLLAMFVRWCCWFLGIHLCPENFFTATDYDWNDNNWYFVYQQHKEFIPITLKWFGNTKYTTNKEKKTTTHHTHIFAQWRSHTARIH